MQSETDGTIRNESGESRKVHPSHVNYGGFCKGICENYIAPRPPSGDRYAQGQVRCTNCEVYLIPQGATIKNGRRVCICCNFFVRTRPRDPELRDAYYQKVQDHVYVDVPSNPTVESTEDQRIGPEINGGKKTTPTFAKTNSEKKTYSELKAFIDGLHLHANYQLVMLKHLISHKTAYRAEIAESLAYFNNKDTSQIDNVKEFMYVPVYEVLVRHGFVTEYRNARYFNRREFGINVELNEYEQYEIDQLLQKRIEEWNKSHGIPENQYPNEGINWNFHRELTHEVKYWIWSVSEENWEILKKEKIWGSKVRPEGLMEWVLPKDQIIFYVRGSKSFRGIFEIAGEWFDDSKNLRWFDEKEQREIIYQSAVPIRLIILGIAKIDDLQELSIFANKDQNLRNLVLKGESGYPSNKRQPVPTMDFEIIRKTHEMYPPENVNPETTDKVQQNSSVPAQYKNETEIRRSPHNSELEITKIFETRPGGIIIKDVQELKEEVIGKGYRFSNDKLSEIFGVGNMGGIRYSKKNNLIVLCETESGQYRDGRSIDFGLFFYTGEGVTGDQEISGGNYRLIHSEKIPIFYFVEEHQEPGKKKRGALDNIYRFVAKVRYQKHIIKTENDITGQPRLLIKFLLEAEN